MFSFNMFTACQFWQLPKHHLYANRKCIPVKITGLLEG